MSRVMIFPPKCENKSTKQILYCISAGSVRMHPKFNLGFVPTIKGLGLFEVLYSTTLESL